MTRRAAYAFVDGADELSFHRPGTRMIEGVLCTGEVVDGQSCGLTGMRLRQWPIPLVVEHEVVLPTGLQIHSSFATDRDLDLGRCGQIVWLRRTHTHVFVRAVIEEGPEGDRVWFGIRAGKYRAFSVGAEGLCTPSLDRIEHSLEWICREGSICQRGANPDAKFTICEASS